MLLTTRKDFSSIDSMPAIEGRRFAAVSLGHDVVGAIRADFHFLRAFAAEVCGVPAEQLTRETVEQHRARLAAAATEG